MANQSYIRVLQAIEAFAREHMQVQKFASDFPEQLPNFATKDEAYPILYVSPTSSIFNSFTNRFDLTVFCYDVIQKDRENINTILSDTHQILNDLTKWIKDGDIEGIDLINSPSVTPINNDLLDYVAGWQTTISIEVDTYSICEIPFNEQPAIIDVVNNIVYSNYLTCETLSSCGTIIDIENNLSGLTETVNTFADAISGNTVSINQLEEDIIKKQNLPTGFITGMQLSINTDNTKFNIGSGAYVITDFSDIENINVQIIEFAGLSGITPTYLTTGNITYIGIDVNQNIIQKNVPFTNEERRSIAILGAVIHSNRVFINVTNEIKAPIVAPTNQLHDFIKAVGVLNLDGNIYGPNGANLMLNKSMGTVFGLGINAQDYLNPHQLTIPSQTGLTFRYRLQNGFEYSDRTTIDPSNYDLNGVLTALQNNNKWSVQHINLFQSGLARIQYGQEQYNSLAEAEADLKTGNFVVESNIGQNAIFRSYLIVKKNATNLSDPTQAKFIPVDKFGNVVSGAVSLTFQAIVDALGYTPADEANMNLQYITDNGNSTTNSIILSDNNNFTVTLDKEFIEYGQSDSSNFGYYYRDAFGVYDSITDDTKFSSSNITSSQVYLEHNESRGPFTANFIRINNELNLKANSGNINIEGDKFEGRDVNIIGNRFGVKTGFFNYGYLNTDNLTNNRTFTFPDASGTVALTSDLDSKVDKFIEVSGVTISSTGWTLNAGFYEYTYLNANITSNSIVDVVPDNSAYSIVTTAQLLPRIDSSNGSIKLYSNKLPSSNFTVTIIINKN